ncbi:aminotransferase class I/II-fold pyridoxal phosphate-dependent enzyme [Mariniflexile sp. AS56]|uniref:aminotransferase class I/II-fold pyridoxal phosphate-dependent enzyme n=1 Tax=Mariniflexile sp. AS56 TaxID=3063957 RepID=UPI0026EED99F|nr:aminotransferase class I/II-fold pyridoxal phosphate-dependent enzyme [Mariniflexile sp. AS56]MDO7171382.1 aminotransferase class I/II-fold pyridoxal phosphate-dependent enzyme [Mariniflexile sp. AS56]
MLTKTKIYLSSPHMGGSEQKFVNEAFDTNWIAPLGPNVDGFEKDIQNYLGNNVHAAVLSSGTASIHIALQLLGVSRGDEVLCQSFTFSASANPIIYQGATPVFIDSESDTWNMCPELLEIAIRDRIEKHKKPKAIIAVHLYGMPYKAQEINEISKKYDIPVIEDSAEAFGSYYNDMPCGALSDIGILSFNGNKIITTSGGGALIVKNLELKEKAVFLSTQARDQAPHYEHSSVGFNYRMSNVLAGIGRGQMEVLDERVAARRHNFNFYKENLSKHTNLSFVDEPQGFFSNRWITCVKTSSYELREEIRLELLKDDIESRPLWKPMHMQPVFKDCLHFTNGTSEALFEKGLCLPSGSNLDQDDLERILNIISKIPNL